MTQSSAASALLQQASVAVASGYLCGVADSVRDSGGVVASRGAPSAGVQCAGVIGALYPVGRRMTAASVAWLRIRVGGS